jgi:hypothetical protein
MRLNIGSADRHMPGYISADIFRPDNAPADFQLADLAGPWPWDTSSVDEVQAHDIAEHIGDCRHDDFQCCTLCDEEPGSAHRHPLGRIHFLNELHRVLKHGSRATIVVPSAAKGVGFITDPTHVTPWCFSLFKYFEYGSFAHTRLSKASGITAAFKVIALYEEQVNAEDSRETVWKITAMLEAIKQ